MPCKPDEERIWKARKKVVYLYNENYIVN